MAPFEQNFTTRQHMVNSDFEFFHYRDASAVDVKYHNHSFYEVYYLISGKVTYIVEGKSYIIKPGDIILINNTELHKPIIDDTEPYERIVIWIDPNYINRQGADGINLLNCFEYSSKNRYNLLRPSDEIMENVRNIILKLEKVCIGAGYGYNILKNAYLNELLVFLNRAFLDTSIEDIQIDIKFNPKISGVINYINDNIDCNISLEILSAKFYLSKYHLLREFKKHTGYTIHNYIKHKRLIMAKNMLKECQHVTEVCSKCGFGDYANFIRSFKKEFGTSPKKYSKSFSSNNTNLYQ